MDNEKNLEICVIRECLAVLVGLFSIFTVHEYFITRYVPWKSVRQLLMFFNVKSKFSIFNLLGSRVAFRSSESKENILDWTKLAKESSKTPFDLRQDRNLHVFSAVSKNYDKEFFKLRRELPDFQRIDGFKLRIKNDEKWFLTKNTLYKNLILRTQFRDLLWGVILQYLKFAYK